MSWCMCIGGALLLLCCFVVVCCRLLVVCCLPWVFEEVVFAAVLLNWLWGDCLVVKFVCFLPWGVGWFTFSCLRACFRTITLLVLDTQWTVTDHIQTEHLYSVTATNNCTHISTVTVTGHTFDNFIFILHNLRILCGAEKVHCRCCTLAAWKHQKRQMVHCQCCTLAAWKQQKRQMVAS